MPENRQVRAVAPSSLALSSVTALDASGDTFVVGGWDNAVYAYSIEYGSISAKLESHDAAVSGVVMVDELTLVSTSWDSTVKVWERKSTRNAKFSPVPVAEMQEHDEAVKVMAIAPDSSLFATASSDGAIVVWDAGTRRAVEYLPDHDGEVTALGFSDHSAWVVSGDDGGTARVTEARTGVVVFETDVSEPVRAVACDGKTLLCSAGTHLQTWALGSGAEQGAQLDLGADVTALAVVGGAAYIGLDDGTIHRVVFNE